MQRNDIIKFQNPSKRITKEEPFKNDATYVKISTPIDSQSVPEDMVLSEEDLYKLQHAKALYENEKTNIVSPEFDLLTLFRSILTSPFSIGESSLKNFRKNGEMMRVVSKEAIKDAEKTGVIRGPEAAGVIQKSVAPKNKSGVTLIANKKRSFNFPYFSKEALAIKPNQGDVIIVGGKNTPWTPLHHKQKTLENPATLSIQELLNAKEPFGTPFVNGQVNMGPISDFRYYDINALGRVVPRQFGQSNIGANYELLSGLTHWVPSLGISEGLRRGVQTSNIQNVSKEKQGSTINYLNYFK